MSSNDYTAADKAKLAKFADADNYALKTDLTSLYKYQGSVASVANLPTGATVGDVYNVEATGMNYAWDGAKWDALGSLMSVESIPNTVIEDIVAGRDIVLDEIEAPG